MICQLIQNLINYGISIELISDEYAVGLRNKLIRNAVSY